MGPIVWLILTLIDIYIWIVIIAVIVQLLSYFGVLDRSNNFVRQIRYALQRLTEPALAPIRRVLPDLGGIDLSPLLLLVLLQFLSIAVATWTRPLL
jgi:YggT family protein